MRSRDKIFQRYQNIRSVEREFYNIGKIDRSVFLSEIRTDFCFSLVSSSSLFFVSSIISTSTSLNPPCNWFKRLIKSFCNFNSFGYSPSNACRRWNESKSFSLNIRFRSDRGGKGFTSHRVFQLFPQDAHRTNPKDPDQIAGVAVLNERRRRIKM